MNCLTRQMTRHLEDRIASGRLADLPRLRSLAGVAGCREGTATLQQKVMAGGES